MRDMNLTFLEDLVENVLDLVRVEFAVVTGQVLEGRVALIRLCHVILSLVTNLFTLTSQHRQMCVYLRALHTYMYGRTARL